MSRTLTAADRSILIRLASNLPVGSAERRAILAGLSRVSMEFDSQDALDKYLKEHPGADKSKHKVKKEEAGNVKGKNIPDNAPDWAKSSKSKRLESVKMDGANSGRVYYKITPAEVNKLKKALDTAESAAGPEAQDFINDVRAMVKGNKFFLNIERSGDTWEYVSGGGSSELGDDISDQNISSMISAYVEELQSMAEDED